MSMVAVMTMVPLVLVGNVVKDRRMNAGTSTSPGAVVAATLGNPMATWMLMLKEPPMPKRTAMVRTWGLVMARVAREKVTTWSSMLSAMARDIALVIVAVTSGKGDVSEVPSVRLCRELEMEAREQRPDAWQNALSAPARGLGARPFPALQRSQLGA